MFITFFLDSRLKVFGERKVYGELRAWFDSRLEDAFKAAEEEERFLPPKVHIIFPSAVSLLPFPSALVKMFLSFFFNVGFLCLF